MRRRLRHWLLAHSGLYRRWRRWRWDRAMRRLEVTIGEQLLAPLDGFTRSLEAWLSDPPIVDVSDEEFQEFLEAQ